MFFDRNEIHIQAFQEIPPAKLIPGDSSSSTFHQIQEFIISNYQKSRNSEFQKFKKWTPKVSKISKISKIAILRFLQMIFSQDVPRFFLVFFEVSSWDIRGSRVHYGSKKLKILEVPRIIRKVLESIRNRILAILE